jgi:hypothetical protein
MAFRAFFAILGGSLPPEIAKSFGYVRASAQKAAAGPPRESAATPADGAVQVLGILQREARLLDFMLEDIGAYADDQIGAAVRNVHAQCQASLRKYFKFAPVLDGVEGTFTRPESAGELARDPAAIRFVGNLPPQGRPAGGTLRHRGWRADSVMLPPINPRQNTTILAPAELEVE